jgi:hypothetical protein
MRPSNGVPLGPMIVPFQLIIIASSSAFVVVGV